MPHESPGAPYRCAPGSLGRWVTFVAAWLAAASPAAAQYGPFVPWGPNVRGPGPPAAAIHPAVARVAVADRDGFSLGSGTLVAASEQHGLLVTNWHVVRDATGPIVVTFPDGFRSPAAVLRTDRDWDLAALAIWRPNCDPVPLASEPPRPGEPLAIAGYGSGRYRTIAGRCTQYLSPGYDKPFEIVELSAPARQGDSGGPIFNSRGELAGVLFGTAMGQTSGSYCGRVRAFLTPLRDDFLRLTPNPLLLAQQRASPQPASQPPAPNAAVGPGPAPVAAAAVASLAPAESVAASAVSPAPAGQPSGSAPAPPTAAIRAADGAATAASPPPSPGPRVASATTAQPADFAITVARTLLDDLKDYLAVVGVAAMVLHTLKLLTRGSAPGRKGRK